MSSRVTLVVLALGIVLGGCKAAGADAAPAPSSATTIAPAATTPLTTAPPASPPTTGAIAAHPVPAAPATTGVRRSGRKFRVTGVQHAPE